MGCESAGLAATADVPHAPPEWISTVEESLHERPIDDDRGLVRTRKLANLERNLIDAEEVRRHQIEPHQMPLPAAFHDVVIDGVGWTRLSLSLGDHGEFGACGDQRKRDGVHSSLRLEPRLQLQQLCAVACKEGALLRGVRSGFWSAAHRHPACQEILTGNASIRGTANVSAISP